VKNYQIDTMKLKSLLYPDLIKIVIIEDGLLKIRNYNGTTKEIEISEIGKIYIENRNSKRYFVYGFSILLVALSIYFSDYFEILILTSILFVSTFLNRFVKLKSKFLVVELKKSKSVYCYKFISNQKETILSTIRKVKSIKNTI
jgi:hypothetical protein